MRFFIKTVIASIILTILCSIHLNGQNIPENSDKNNCYAIAITPNTYTVTQEKVLVKEAHTKLVEIPPVYKTIIEKIPIKQEQELGLNTSVDKHFDFTDNKSSQPKAKGVMNFIPASTTGCNDGCDEEENTEMTEAYVEHATQAEALKLKTNKLLEREKYEDIIAFGQNDNNTKSNNEQLAVIEAVEYKTVERVVMLKPATTMEVTVPATYEIKEHRTLVEEGTEKLWIPVLCPTKVTSLNISQLQLALKAKGYFNGEINGRLDESTRVSLKKYQQHNTLPVGQLDFKTLESLGFNTDMF